MICKIKPVVGHLDTKEKNTILFAARELAKYLGLCDPYGDFPVIPVTEGGTDKDSLYVMVGAEGLPAVSDKSLDDAILINTNEIYGLISGANARATLIAAYRFLRENGFGFTKPGKAGETIPKVFANKKLSICEVPSYRHRGVCIEGATPQDVLIELIDWLPKVSMNAYFIQFFDPSAFYRRFYGKYDINLTDDEITAMANQLRGEIAQRSLLYHAVGHGWTAKTLGVDGNSWDDSDATFTEDKIQMMAMIDGERGLFRKQPQNTNLCYSNSAVRDKMTDTILHYCEENLDVDYLHFWLADFSGNVCECDECLKMRLADYYVKMLNELDEKLTKKGLKTKVVFLIYSSLLWGPLSETFKNSDRFVLMFAPFNRSYAGPLTKDGATKVPPYPRNKDKTTIGTGECLAFLLEWQDKVGGGDSFDYDYHFCLGSMYEFTGFGLAKTLHADSKNFKELDINGLISCQGQRIFLPTALGMNMMAEVLWNNGQDFTDVSLRILGAQFGDYAKVVFDYLESLDALSTSEALRQTHDVGLVENPDNVRSDANKEKMKKANGIIEAFRKDYDAVAKAATGNEKRNWDALFFGTELIRLMNTYYITEGEDALKELKDKIYAFVKEEGNQFKTEFDKESYLLPEV